MRAKLTISIGLQFLFVAMAFSVAAQQLNFATGTFSNLQQTNQASSPAFVSLKTAATVNPCTGKNTFWGIESVTKQLNELRINNGLVELTGNTIPNSSLAGFNLAIGNNLNGGSLSPTFYTNNFTDYLYWDGISAWIPTAPAPIQIYNTGAYKNNFYGLTYTSNSISILKYDGVTYTPIITLPKGTGCADLAVDSLGNCYLVSSPAFSTTSDSLYIISPSGQILNQYAFVLNSIHAYGSFILDGKFYIGLGSGHPDFPNTILPVLISGTTATAGTPMPMPGTLELSDDLASCVVNPVVISESDSSSLEYPTVFTPNNDGVNDWFLPFKKNIVDLNCKIFNRWGQLVAELTTIDMAWDGHSISGIAQPAGVYYYIAKGTGKDDKLYDLHGCVTLLR